jgi:hypothetical protein
LAKKLLERIASAEKELCLLLRVKQYSPENVAISSFDVRRAKAALSSG